MGVFVAWVSNVTTGLLLLSGAISLYALLRRREWYRVDVLYVVACYGVMTFNGNPRHPVAEALWYLAGYSLPYFLLRLSPNQSTFARWMRVVALIMGPVAAVTLMASGNADEVRALNRFGGVVTCAVGVAFAHRARRASGAAAGRLMFLSVGIACWGLGQSITPLNLYVWHGLRAALGQNYLWVYVIAQACFAIAFTPPAWLRARWRRAGQSDYLVALATRDPETTRADAARDLARLAASGIGNGLTVVALRSDDENEQPICRSNDSSLPGLTVDFGEGLVAKALESGRGVGGPVSALAPALTAKLAPFGQYAMVAPIASDSRTWGVAIVVQRRATIFLNDHLIVLTDLAAATATSLDHARLIAERRSREHRRAEQRLREVESHMSLMLDSIKDYAMFVIDDAGKVVAWQGGADHVFGYDANAIVERSAMTLYDVGPDGFAVCLDDARRTGRVEFEGLCRRRDGTTFTGATTIRPIDPSIEEGVGGFVAVTQDVTAHRALAERIRQGQKMEAVGRLAGGIAHDFNNQLTAIIGYADSLCEDLDAGDVRRKDALQIVKAGERAAGLTRQLLTFSRRREFKPVALSLTALVDDLLPMLRRVIGEHITIVHQASTPDAHVRADRSQLEQVVINLAVNARDAMPNGGHLQIRTSRHCVAPADLVGDLSSGSYGRLEVEDDGVGMDAATRARIFEPFFTTKEHGKGTGLGLATVYGVVQQMGGAALVTSDVGQGATFDLLFPEVPAEQRIAAAAELMKPAGGRETVLLVEDEAPVRVLLAHALEKHGYRVISADRQQAALASLVDRGDDIDLVIADVVMPEGSGPALVQEVSARHPGVRALYISGHGDSWGGQAAQPPPDAHFLQKPFSPADLIARVSGILADAQGHPPQVPDGHAV